VLDDIAVGPFAEQPAGKGAPPFAVGAAAHVELHEGAGFLHIFPGRGGFARLQADDGVADAQRFARLHAEVAGQAVALVEQADDGGALGHRGAGQGGAVGTANRGAFDPHRAGLIRARHVIVAASGQRQQAQEQRRRCRDRRDAPHRAADHDASGLHAS